MGRGAACSLPPLQPCGVRCWLAMLREAGIQWWPSSPMCMVHFLQGDAGAALSRSHFNPFIPFLPPGSVFPVGWTLTWLAVGGMSGCLELLLSQHLTAARAGEEATELCGWKTQRRRCCSGHPCRKDPAQRRLGGVRASFRAEHWVGCRKHELGLGLGAPTKVRAGCQTPWRTPQTLRGYCWSPGCMCKVPWKIPTPLSCQFCQDSSAPPQALTCQGKGFNGMRLTWSPIVWVLR